MYINPDLKGTVPTFWEVYLRFVAEGFLLFYVWYQSSNQTLPEGVFPKMSSFNVETCFQSTPLFFI